MLDAAREIRLQAHCGSQANSAIPRSHVSTRRACGYIVVVTNLYEIHTFPQRSFPIISVWEASMMTTTSSVPLLICNKSSVKRWTIFPHRWLPATPTGCASLYSTLQRHAVSPFLFWAKEFFCFLKGGDFTSQGNVFCQQCLLQTGNISMDLPEEATAVWWKKRQRTEALSCSTCEFCIIAMHDLNAMN